MKKIFSNLKNSGSAQTSKLWMTFILTLLGATIGLAQCATVHEAYVYEEGGFHAIHIEWSPTSSGQSSIAVLVQCDGGAFEQIECINLGGLGTGYQGVTDLVTDCPVTSDITVRVQTHTNGSCGGSMCDVPVEFDPDNPIGVKDIQANNDIYVIDTNGGSYTTPSIFENDTLEGSPLNLSDIDFTIVDDSDLPAGVTVNPDGTVSIPAGTFPGIYTFTYKICEKDADPANCDTATVTLHIDMCVEEVAGRDFHWNYLLGESPTNPVVETFTQPGADGGFTLDILYLDNSFNMNINGTMLATNEIEFETTVTTAINIMFVDGTRYEADVDDIWTLEGDAARPILRIRINANGTVDMFGAKESYGPLYPLMPISGLANSFTFNHIDWNTDTDNVITVSQNIVNITGMTGRGYGVTYVDCFCMKPAVGGTPSTTSVGITTKGDVLTVNDWPESVPNGYLVMDSSDKGFVVTHMTSAQRDALDPVEGMLIYNTDESCIQMYRGESPDIDAPRTGWNCLERSCND